MHVWKILMRNWSDGYEFVRTTESKTLIKSLQFIGTKTKFSTSSILRKLTNLCLHEKARSCEWIETIRTTILGIYLLPNIPVAIIVGTRFLLPLLLRRNSQTFVSSSLKIEGNFLSKVDATRHSPLLYPTTLEHFFVGHRHEWAVDLFQAKRSSLFIYFCF